MTTQQKQNAQAISTDALVQAVLQSHQATTKLMDVQFQAVRDNFDSIHKAMAEVKADLNAETRRIAKEVSENRLLADERHLSLVKRVWAGIGGVAALEALLTWHPWAR